MAMTSPPPSIDVVVVTGPSGAGKTALVERLASLLHADGAPLGYICHRFIQEFGITPPLPTTPTRPPSAAWHLAPSSRLSQHHQVAPQALLSLHGGPRH